MAAANKISGIKDLLYSIPGHGKPLTEQEREELLRRGWSKKPSPLVNPILGNQLKIKPGNPREQLLAQTSASLDGTVWGGNKLGHINKTQAAKMVKDPSRFGLDPAAVMRLSENLGIQV